MKSKLITVGIILIFVVGLLLVFNNPIQTYLIGKMSDTLVETPVDQIQKNIEKDANFDFDEVQTLTILDVLRAQSNQQNLPVIGSMAIPAVDLQLPMLKGVGRDALAVGAGTMKEMQQLGTGNYALAGHYFEGKDILFGPLYHLKIGDKIYLTDMQNAYIYKASMIDVIEATDVYIIEDVADEKLLTLITCAENGKKRLAVQAKFVEQVPLNELEQEIF